MVDARPNEELLDEFEAAVIRYETGQQDPAAGTNDEDAARAPVLARMVKPSPYARCTMCGAPLDVPGRPWSRNCGGDCIACMAESDDPECEEAVAAMRAGEAVVRAGRAIATAAAGDFDIETETGAVAWGQEVKLGLTFEMLRALRDALPPEKGEER